MIRSPRILTAAAFAAVALSACSEKLPSGEPALREAMGAMSSEPLGTAGVRMANDMAELTINLAGGFAGEPIYSQWNGKMIAARVDAAIKPNAKRLEDAIYASMAKSIPAEVTQQLVADTRDPARLAALKCAYKPGGMQFSFSACDIKAFGDPKDWGPRYVALKTGLDHSLSDPVALGIIGTAACDVSDEFLTAAKKANPRLKVGDFKITRDGTSYDCPTLRKMAAPASAK